MGFNTSTQLPNDIRAHDTIIYDSAGNIVSTFGTDTTGLATEAKQNDIITAIEAIPATDVSTLSTSANQTNGNQQTKIKETTPVDATKTNASYTLSYNASDELVRVDKVISGTTYRKSIVPPSADTTITQTKTISAYVQQ